MTMVHECTHLFLNTDDDAYGVPMCEVTAARTPAIAKKTADCWGYFVEEFRRSQADPPTMQALQCLANGIARSIATLTACMDARHGQA